MMEMNDYLHKMEAIVRKDCESRISNYFYTDVCSRSMLNGRVEAEFVVTNMKDDMLLLYNVIYFICSNKIRVFVFKPEDKFDVKVDD